MRMTDDLDPPPHLHDEIDERPDRSRRKRSPDTDTHFNTWPSKRIRKRAPHKRATDDDKQWDILNDALQTNEDTHLTNDLPNEDNVLTNEDTVLTNDLPNENTVLPNEDTVLTNDLPNVLPNEDTVLPNDLPNDLPNVLQNDDLLRQHFAILEAWLFAKRWIQVQPLTGLESPLLLAQRVQNLTGRARDLGFQELLPRA
jgi:hypothetical protein